MVIMKGNSKNLGVRPTPVVFRPPRISHESVVSESEASTWPSEMWYSLGSAVCMCDLFRGGPHYSTAN
jgi:hypothetical protein